MESKDILKEDEFLYDEKKIEEEIQNQLSKLDDLKCEQIKIQDKSKLIDEISQIVWEQFIIQIAGKAGTDFIKENNNLNLSLKKSDHYLNHNEFVNGKLPSHNFENAEKYQKRYEDINKKVTRKNNLGLNDAGWSKDHVVSIHEFNNNPEIITYGDYEDRQKLANSPINIQDLPIEVNQDKGSMPMSEWLKTDNAKKLIKEYNLDEKELIKKDKEAREAIIENNKKIALNEGKKSRNAEMLRSAKSISQAVTMALLAKFTKVVFQELISWLIKKDRNVKTLVDNLKNAFLDFLKDFKNNGLLIVDVSATTILTQLFGEIVTTIRSVLLFGKCGIKNLKEIIKYLNNPENKGKDTATIILEIGKIVITGLTTTSAITLGMSISSTLNKIPAFKIQVPLLGSFANILGTFLGGLVSGICGALALSAIDNALKNKLLSKNMSQQLVIQNGILVLQGQQFALCETNMNAVKEDTLKNICNNIIDASNKIQEIENSMSEDIKTSNEDKLNDISTMLKDLN